MLGDFWSGDINPQALAYIAGGLFTLGYVIINQIVLRVLIGIGTLFYIWYYWVVADAPLWEAIVTSVIMGTANLIGLAQLLVGRSNWAIPRAHRDIYPMFKDIPPGDFRNVVLQADRITLPTGTEMTTEGEAVSQMYFVISGATEATKQGETFALPAGVFVGEVAYLTERKASATTRVTKEVEVLRWDVAKIKKRSRKQARFKLALDALISKDMALKVAFSVAPRRATWNPETETQGISRANPAGTMAPS